MSKQTLFKNPDVKHAYDALIEARRTFNLARIYLVQVKQYFQDIIDPELYAKKLIFQSKCWEFILDEDGNMLYKDSDEDYEVKAKHYIAKERLKTQRGTKFDDDKIDWKGLKKGTAELPKNDTTDVSQATFISALGDTSTDTENGLPDKLEGNEEAHLAAYRKLVDNEEKHQFFYALEHFSIRLGVARVCEISFAFFFGNPVEKGGDCCPKLLNSARLHFA